MTRLIAFGTLIGALNAGAVLAQTTEQPPRLPAPPQAAAPAAPELRAPAVVPPPPRPATAAPAAATRGATPAAEPLKPMSRAGTPADSVRPRPTPVAAPPANAVAQCVDGTFIVAPNDASGCSSHRGVLVRFPVRTPPPRPGTGVTPVASTSQLRAPVSPAQAPAGATMQCKDGTWLMGTPSASRCDANGGVAAILPAPRQTPPPPAQGRRP